MMLSMLVEILFPQKLVSLGTFLMVASVLIPFLMLLSVIPVSFSLFFLTTGIAAVGGLIRLVGCSCYSGNLRV